MKYAKQTQVPIDRSKGEIEKILARYGASQFAYATKPEIAVILFQVKDTRVRFNLPLPPQDDFSRKKSGKLYSREMMLKRWEQGCRS